MTNPTETTIPYPTYSEGPESTVHEHHADGTVTTTTYRPWQTDGGFHAHEAFADAILTLSPPEALAALVADFQAAHEPHRQYDGWTDDKVLLRVKCKISGKGGVKAITGDYVIGSQSRGMPAAGIPAEWTVYAPRIGWNLGGLTSADVEVVTWRCEFCGYTQPANGHHPDCEGGEA